MAEGSRPAIAVRGLRKSFGKLVALDDVTFDVARGEVFGYLGPNGAGKTTTIRLLLDLLRRDAGSVEVLGVDPRRGGPEIRGRIGYLPGDGAMWGFMSGRELIARLGRIRGMRDMAFAHGLAERFRLDLDRPIGHLSRGNRQKVGIVLAFMHEPELAVLDEPTSGLDPLMQLEFYALVREWADAGRTVFLSSHVMAEVERIAGRVAIIRDGRVVAIDEVEDLKRRVPRQLIAHFAHEVDPESFASLAGITVERDHARELRFTVGGALPPLLRLLADHDVASVETLQGDLEHAFLHYYGDRVGNGPLAADASPVDATGADAGAAPATPQAGGGDR